MQIVSSPASQSSNRRQHVTRWTTRHAGSLTLLAILLVVLITLGTRLNALNTQPPGLAPDELTIVQEARADLSLIPDASTATASYGPSYRWLVRVSGSLGGWNVLTVRLSAVLLGLLFVIAMFQMAREGSTSRLGLAVGLAAASVFPLIVFSRRADPAVVAGALATIALLCLLRVLHAESDRQRWWWIGSAVALGLGLYSHITFILIVPLLLIVGLGLVVTGRAGTAHIDRTGVMLALAILLVMVAPIAARCITEPETLRGWLEIDWDGDGTVERIGAPWEVVEGYAVTWRSLVWGGYDAWPVNLPGRPLLDPLLAAWVIVGLLVILRHPGHARQALTLGWLLIAMLSAALVAPGHPGLLLPALPALLLCLVIGVDAALRCARSHGAMWERAASTLVVASLLMSALWSSYDYYWSWSGADDTYVAYQGDVRDALRASERLADTSASDTPVYLSLAGRPGSATSDDRTLAAFLADDASSSRWIDGRTTLVIPMTGSGYVVYPMTVLPDPTLRALLSASGQTVAESGQTPDGALAWEAWRVDQRTRAALPFTVPTIRFPDGYELVGFSVAPDFGAVATTGQLPDPPRIAVTLVWSAPVSTGPHTVRVRLVPTGAGIDPAVAAGLAQIAETTVVPSRTIVNGSVRELIVTRLSVVVPQMTIEGADATDGVVLDVQAGLLAADGDVLAPLSPPSARAGDFAHLNQIEYVPDAR